METYNICGVLVSSNSAALFVVLRIRLPNVYEFSS